MKNFFQASRKSIITSYKLKFEKIRNNISRLIPVHFLLQSSGRSWSEPFLFSKNKKTPERGGQPINGHERSEMVWRHEKQFW